MGGGIPLKGREGGMACEALEGKDHFFRFFDNVYVGYN